MEIKMEKETAQLYYTREVLSKAIDNLQEKDIFININRYKLNLNYLKYEIKLGTFKERQIIADLFKEYYDGEEAEVRIPIKDVFIKNNNQKIKYEKIVSDISSSYDDDSLREYYYETIEKFDGKVKKIDIDIVKLKEKFITLNEIVKQIEELLD